MCICSLSSTNIATRNISSEQSPKVLRYQIRIFWWLKKKNLDSNSVAKWIEDIEFYCLPKKVLRLFLRYIYIYFMNMVVLSTSMYVHHVYELPTREGIGSTGTRATSNCQLPSWLLGVKHSEIKASDSDCWAISPVLQRSSKLLKLRSV